MHISDPDTDVFAVSTAAAAALKKRKRDGVLWNQENIENIEGGLQPYQLEYQDINMLAPTPRFIAEPSATRPQWLHLQQNSTTPAMQKKRRILQPQLNRQPQCLRPHSGSLSQAQSNADNQSTKKASLPALTIPSFNNHHDPSFLSMSGSDEDLISPRTTTTPTTTLLIPPPVLRPCHVCHRKPSTKVMLDAYADCELCGQRACYICLRECNSVNCGNIPSLPETPNEYQGDDYGMDIRRDDGYLHTRTTHFQQTPTLHNHSNEMRRRKICSCCAVEGLTDTGEEIVWCMGCVRREETSPRVWQ